MFMLFWRKIRAFAVICFGVCFQLVLLYSLLPQRKSYLFSFLRQVTPPSHCPLHHCLSSLEQSDISYIFHLCILQLISCYYFFSFFLKCITQFLQDKIISFVLASIPTIFLAMSFLMNKPSIYFLLSHLSFNSSSLCTWLPLLPLYEYQPYQGVQTSNLMTSFQTLYSSTYLHHSALLMSINKDVDFENTHT